MPETKQQRSESSPAPFHKHSLGVDVELPFAGDASRFIAPYLNCLLRVECILQCYWVKSYWSENQIGIEAEAKFDIGLY